MIGHTQTRRLTHRILVGARLGATLLIGACGVSDEGPLPPGVQDPATLKTPAGALGRYRAAVAAFGGVVDGAMVTGGLLTDELTALPLPAGTVGPFTALDSRQAPAFSPARFHRLRGEARDTRGFLRTYAPDSSPMFRGHLFALEGYAELYLADLFCSGIPLSTVEFDGNYTLAAGSTRPRSIAMRSRCSTALAYCLTVRRRWGARRERGLPPLCRGRAWPGAVGAGA